MSKTLTEMKIVSLKHELQEKKNSLDYWNNISPSNSNRGHDPIYFAQTITSKLKETNSRIEKLKKEIENEEKVLRIQEELFNESCKSNQGEGS